MKTWINDYGDIPRWYWLIRPRFPRHSKAWVLQALAALATSVRA